MKSYCIYTPIVDCFTQTPNDEEFTVLKWELMFQIDDFIVLFLVSDTTDKTGPIQQWAEGLAHISHRYRNYLENYMLTSFTGNSYNH